jgi:plasmid stabilization system protein ParE
VKAIFLSGAEEDLKELRRYLIKRFGKSTWRDTYGKIKTSVRGLQAFPLAGSVPEELADLGLSQYRQVISGMNRIIYEVGDEVLYIHIVCDTRRDMQTLLINRILRMTKK